MSLHTRVSGTWKDVNGVYVKQSGVWTRCESVHTRVSGSWKEAWRGGNDSYTKLLLHCDGSNGSTTITDSSSGGKTVTCVDNAALSTAQYKFGTASLYFDGTLDCVTLTDSDDWCLSDTDFTIDFWLRLPSLPSAYKAVFSNRENSGSYRYGFVFWILNTNKPHFAFYDTASSSYTCGGGDALSANTWYHFAVERYNNTLTMYKDGVAEPTTGNLTGKTNINLSTKLAIGRDGEYLDYNLYGYVDEFRWTKGVARFRGAFTPPVLPYS